LLDRELRTTHQGFKQAWQDYYDAEVANPETGESKYGIAADMNKARFVPNSEIDRILNSELYVSGEATTSEERSKKPRMGYEISDKEAKAKGLKSYQDGRGYATLTGVKYYDVGSKKMKTMTIPAHKLMAAVQDRTRSGNYPITAKKNSAPTSRHISKSTMVLEPSLMYLGKKRWNDDDTAQEKRARNDLGLEQKSTTSYVEKLTGVIPPSAITPDQWKFLYNTTQKEGRKGIAQTGYEYGMKLIGLSLFPAIKTLEAGHVSGKSKTAKADSENALKYWEELKDSKAKDTEYVPSSAGLVKYGKLVGDGQYEIVKGDNEGQTHRILQTGPSYGEYMNAIHSGIESEKTADWKKKHNVKVPESNKASRDNEVFDEVDPLEEVIGDEVAPPTRESGGLPEVKPRGVKAALHRQFVPGLPQTIARDFKMLKRF
jgi:hypothetical protein